MSVPVIDLFAGPGGLGEGFNRSTAADFRVAVSIEKDGMAYETLRLRAAHRALLRSGQASQSTWVKWDQVLAEHPWNIVFDVLSGSSDPLIARACQVAKNEAWNLELGPATREDVSDGIRRRLRSYGGGVNLPRNAVLIGGPPCQAYSIVGRSRNRGTRGYAPENDHRHFLYLEYLHVINQLRPAVFVMENVKGILTSKVLGRQLFRSILADLKRPDHAIGERSDLDYELVALARQSNDLFDFKPEDFIVKAESHGIPQARHRVIICGIRRDIFDKARSVGHLTVAEAPSVRNVIADLPPLRGGVSFRGRGIDWLQAFDGAMAKRMLKALNENDDAVSKKVALCMESAYNVMQRRGDLGTGKDRLLIGSGGVSSPLAGPQWYKDRPLALLANHESRAHMPSDLVRYFFVSTFGEVTGRSPRLHDFPVCILPSHKNINPQELQSAIFKDRFRVQIADTYSMTVTSHIAKDGHAFIHYDPLQCRSLTVREAARIQTFPDSYVFLGNRTSQFAQVGNAVPPLLALKIADIVGGVLSRAGVAGGTALSGGPRFDLSENKPSYAGKIEIHDFSGKLPRN
jgi:DNA (cytosine-5)-methyltransferase 1